MTHRSVWEWEGEVKWLPTSGHADRAQALNKAIAQTAFGLTDVEKATSVERWS